MYSALFVHHTKKASFCSWSLFGFALGCSPGTLCNVNVRTSGSKSGWMTVRERGCSVYRKEEEQKPSLDSHFLHVVMKPNAVLSCTDCGNKYLKNYPHKHVNSVIISEYPRAEVIPAVVSQMAGSDATVMCSVSGAPTPELSWSLNSSDHPPLSTSLAVTSCFKYKASSE